MAKVPVTHVQDAVTDTLYGGTVSPELAAAAKKAKGTGVLAKAVTQRDDYGQAKGVIWLPLAEDDVTPGQVTPGEYRSVIVVTTQEDE
jgi:hypothetical protein